MFDTGLYDDARQCFQSGKKFHMPLHRAYTLARITYSEGYLDYGSNQKKSEKGVNIFTQKILYHAAGPGNLRNDLAR